MALGFEDMHEPMTIIHPVGLDEWGDPVAGTGTSEKITEAIYAPGPSTEGSDNANTVDTDGTVYIEPATATAVADTDRFLIRGQLYEVAGKPRLWLNRIIEIPVRIVTG